MKNHADKKTEIFTPKWAEGRAGRYIFRKPKVMPLKYSCGKCEEINELVIPTNEGKYDTRCIYCNAINRVYRKPTEYNLF